MVDLSVDIFANKRFDLIEQARQIEDEVDDMENKCIEDHINRLKAGDCEPRGGVIYTDLVSDLERISDHALNIAEAILGAIVI
jgi:phosphate:Na+ symporter